MNKESSSVFCLIQNYNQKMNYLFFREAEQHPSMVEKLLLDETNIGEQKTLGKAVSYPISNEHWKGWDKCT